MKKFSTKALIQIAIMGALGGVLLKINFPIPIAPSFYKIDFSDVPALIGAFSLGPLATVYIQLIKIIIKLLIDGTQTAFVGELSKFIISLSLTLPAAIIYTKNRSKKGAIISLVISCLTMVVMAAITNYFLIIPAYVKFMNFPLEAIIGLGAKIYPAINSKLMLVLLCTVPFNLIQAILTSIITFLLYKRISPLIDNNR